MANYLSIFMVLLVIMGHVFPAQMQNLREEEEIYKTSPSLYSQKVEQSMQILREALAVARDTKDRADRVEGLLIVAPLLEKFAMEEFNGVLDEAAALVPKLPEVSSIWKPKNLLLRDPDITIAESIVRKDELTSQLVELLAGKKPSKALDLALSQSQKNDYARALGIERSLRSWPRMETEAAISKIRDLAAGSQKEKPSVATLAALASGAELHDTNLARELANRVIEALNLKAGAFTSRTSYQFITYKSIIEEPMTSIWAYEKACQILATIDMEAAKQFLMKLMVSPDVNIGNLIAFARGVASTHPELAWQALTALEGI